MTDYKDGDGTYRLGGDRRVKASELKAGESIVVVTTEGSNTSYLFTVYRPPRRKNESPIQYYKRTGCVDNRYYLRHRGHYYCNPAHCSGTWKDKKKRDEHLDMAYAILG
jgi:hypothetical protein